MEKDIDFVIIWVDGSDPEWLAVKRQYEPEEDRKYNTNDARFRDWDLLKYWFRSVECYAPWVRKIHFVTAGHYPAWLNLQNEKLHFVKHADFIPLEYLPTFSSFPIELNIHRIEGLSEQFVYFNDDMYVTAPVKPTDFFISGFPRDLAIRNIPMLYEIGHINLNCINLINREFSFMVQFKRNLRKWMNYRYGVHALRNLFFLPFVEFTGVKNAHVANAYLKSTYKEVWDKCGKELDATCRHRFRDIHDLDQWIFKYWQIVSGSFFPQWYHYGVAYGIENTDKVAQDLMRRKHKLVCLQDCEGMQDIRVLKDSVHQLFEHAFPDKSSFEL